MERVVAHVQATQAGGVMAGVGEVVRPDAPLLGRSDPGHRTPRHRNGHEADVRWPRKDSPCAMCDVGWDVAAHTRCVGGVLAEGWYL